MTLTWLDPSTLLRGNSLLEWSLALGVGAAVFTVLWTLRGIVRRRHRKLLATEKTELLEIPLEVLSRTALPTLAVVALLSAANLLELGDAVSAGVRRVLMVVLFFQAGLWASTAVTAWVERRRREAMQRDRGAAGSMGILSLIGRFIVWSTVLLLLLDNLGIDVTALVTGLGIGGVAVALALQNILGDLFASLSITLDRPFVVGDFLVIDDVMGTVENIGIKSTRLRSLGGEQLVLSNADLLRSRLRNFGRMQERRVVFRFGVTYDTATEDLQNIPGMVRGYIEAREGTRFDRCHFAGFGDSSLDFEAVYFVLSADYNRYMDVQQAINLDIHRGFGAVGLDFAFPTRTLHLAGTAPGDRAPGVTAPAAV